MSNRTNALATPFRAIAFLALAALAVAPIPARAAELTGLEGWHAGQSYDRQFAPASVVRVRGVLRAIEHFVPEPGMAEGVRALLVSGADSVWVHLGPAAFVEAQRVRLAVGDAVTATGSRPRIEDRHTLLAVKIEKGGLALRLREHDGSPAWTDFRPAAPRPTAVR